MKAHCVMLLCNLAGDIGEATKLLQHSSQRLTERHYRNKAEKLRAVR